MIKDGIATMLLYSSVRNKKPEFHNPEENRAHIQSLRSSPIGYHGAACSCWIISRWVKCFTALVIFITIELTDLGRKAVNVLKFTSTSHFIYLDT